MKNYILRNYNLIKFNEMKNKINKIMKINKLPGAYSPELYLLIIAILSIVGTYK